MRASRAALASIAGVLVVGIAVGAAVWAWSPSQSKAPIAAALPQVPHLNVPAPTKVGAPKGTVRLTGQVPVTVAHSAAKLVGPHARDAQIRLSFGFPLDRAGIDKTIADEARTHHYLTRAELYAKFSPSQERYNALASWLTGNGFTIAHTGADRLALSATASTATIERVLHVKINDYLRAGSTSPFYSNSIPAAIPARFGIQSISGLSDVDRFFTNAQLATHSPGGTRGVVDTNVRSGGYFPSDLRSIYDASGHGFDGTGQTIGFVLWGAGVYQPALTTFATTTGDTPITVDPPCVAVSNSPTVPSGCSTVHVAGDHLLTILENGNTNNQFGGGVETALDVEQAHGMAPHAALKYYTGDCSASPPAGSGLSNGGSCNGSDVGMEEAIEDAANDPTLHIVSNSWGFGGEAEWANADPFLLASENSFALAAAAGTTFYFSTGDSGVYFSGYPADSQYVVGVGGTTLSSTSNSGVLSTATTWAGAGSWCSNTQPRPVWQTGATVSARAGCPGRAVPDISAVADPSSGVRFTSSTNTTTGTQSGSVGGTSLAAPVVAGMAASTENFIAAQTYSGPTPQMGFAGPVIYQLGNSHASSYFRDVVCGNTANPSGETNGDAAQVGWDPATGWGEPDWFNYSTGYAIALGATNLSVPASLATNYRWSCAKTPGNSSERSISCPSAAVCYAVGAAGSGTPWYAKFVGAGWGASNTFYKSTDGGQTWVPANGDMIAISCSSSTACVEAGDGGRIKTTADGGATWSTSASPFTKTLTNLNCPSASTCYAVGDRGTVIKSTDGGASWAYLPSIDGNPLFGLTCVDTSTCYGTDLYAHVIKTTNGGASWSWFTTPVTTPGVAVPGSGGPNPFAGLFGISCVSASTCVAVGGFPPVGTDAPIVTSTDGGSTWVLRTSNSGTTNGAGNYLNAVSCLPATTTCFAVGRNGSIVTTTNLTTWTKMTSNTTNLLNSITCLSAALCYASGNSGTVDIWNGATWTATSGLGNNAFLASISCTSATQCYAAGKQGVTISTSDGGAHWTQLAGGGTTQQMNSIACVSDSLCTAVGNAGTIVRTTNAGQTWLPLVSGVTTAINGIACTSATACVAVGATATGTPTPPNLALSTTDGTTWATHATGITTALNGVSCGDTTCVAVGAAGVIRTSTDGGATWAGSTSGTTATLSGVTCPSDTCYAVGAATGSPATATLLASLDGGLTWTAQSLTGVACVDDADCFAGGAIGTVLATNDGGAHWTQQGDPLSGPTNALSNGPTGSLAINAAGCSPARCFMGAAANGNILASPLLTVAVNTSSSYGSTPNLTNLPPLNPAISYSPPAEAGNVTGSLTCSTTADATSHTGLYPISGCSGLDDAGFNLIYDYASSSHTVVAAAQTISMAAIADHTYLDPDFDVSATASSGLTVAFSATGNCTSSGTTIHITGAGSCTVTASQGGNSDYQAAPNVVQTFAINKADQTIAFGALGDQTFGAADFQIDPTASSGLAVSLASTGPCTLDSATAPANVHISGAGTCMVTASQPGDANFNAAPDVPRSFAIAKASQTITFAALADHTYLDPDFTVAATASSGRAVSFTAAGNCTVSGTTVHITSAGSCTVTASQPGDDNWNPAPDVARTFAIAKANQTITFAPLSQHTFGDPDFTVSATASSGLAVSFAATGSCTIASGVVHIVAPGPCTVTASQSGNGNYNPAPSVAQTFGIVNTTVGSVSGHGLQLLSGGHLDLDVKAGDPNPSGSLRYEATPVKGHHGPPTKLESTQITALGIAADGNSAWIAGTGKNGESFLLYVEDNSRKVKHSADIAKLWINGVLQTGTGALRHGDLRISQTAGKGKDGRDKDH